ncbi:MAG: uracil-DNA glycosylase [Hyphomicrobiales bacterium]|nr:MAG: uracil-DNA glycosylase [Hyphomicrobiales bacterium]
MNQIEALKDVLQFYADAGVNIALDDAPHDRLAAPPPKIRPPLPEQQIGQQAAQQAAPIADTKRPATVSQDENAQAARQLAASATSLDELLVLLSAYEGCTLRKTAKNTVFEDGNRTAKIMLIGEAPGRDEDIQGKPFVGRSGQLLDKILTAVGLDRTSVYIANILPWRPPGNRTPTPSEMELCKPFITRQIELIQPELLVFLGASAAKNLLDTTDGILKLRGKWRSYSAADIPVLPTLHPAYLLRQPAQKRLVWRDFLSLKSKFDALS